MYGKLEKCMFLSIRITLHSYIVVGDELRVAPKKVPKNVHEVRNIDLASFYRRFIRNLSSLMVSITKLMMKGEFRLDQSSSNSFDPKSSPYKDSLVRELVTLFLEALSFSPDALLEMKAQYDWSNIMVCHRVNMRSL